MDPNKNHEVVVGVFAPPPRRRSAVGFRFKRRFLYVIAPVALLVISGAAFGLIAGLHGHKVDGAHLSDSHQKSTNSTSPTSSGTGSNDSSKAASSGNSTTSASVTAPTSKPSTTTATAPKPSSGSTSNSGSTGGGSSGGSGGSGGSSTPSWVGDFASGNLNGWFLQACTSTNVVPGTNPTPPQGVTVSTSPGGSGGQYVTAFTVADNSTSTNCTGTNGVPTTNPRAQLFGPNLFANNSNWYIGFSTYFPAGFPAPPSWFQFAEIYGKPFGGSPSMGFDVKGTNLVLDRDSTHNYDTIWSAPLQTGTWENIIAHVEFSTDPNTGYIELWLNGVQQHFSDGSTRVYYDTLVSGINWDGSTPNALILNQYRNAAYSMGTITIYHAEAKAGSTYSSVLP